jgi:cyclase
VCIGTAALERPEIVEAAAQRFGSQAIVVAVDVRRDPDGRAEVWGRSGTSAGGRDAVEVAGDLEERGAGEILLTSIDRDGTMEGYDIDLVASVARAVAVPVIASGGAGTYDHLLEAVRSGGASAVAAASMFHFTEQTPMGAKEHLGAHGVPVRK